MPAPTSRFSNRVADYVRARPTYPAAVVDVLRDRLGLDGSWRVADVGAGTGISARLFLDAGCDVDAVEPNAAMRDAMIAGVGPHDRFRAVDGTAEATTLPAASVDLVVAAQAFHWFDRPAFRRECVRILRPGGAVAILFNDRPAAGTAFLVGYERLLLAHGVDYAAVNHRNLGERAILDFFAPAVAERVVMRNVQRLGRDGLAARVFSSSYAPAPDDPRAASARAAIARLFDETNVDGVVEIVYETQLSFGRLA